jgi:hypothetical protein
MSLTLRTSTNRTLNEMLELHEGLLERLHQIIPHSDQRHRNAHEPRIVAGQRHRRFKSLDEVYANRIEAPSYRKPSGTFLEANIGAKVAEVFGRQVSPHFNRCPEMMLILLHRCIASSFMRSMGRSMNRWSAILHPHTGHCRNGMHIRRDLRHLLHR